jgi:hypothetical protein
VSLVVLGFAWVVGNPGNPPPDLMNSFLEKNECYGFQYARKPLKSVALD